MSNHICRDYKRYGFCEDVPYKSTCENIKEYLDNKFDGIDNTDTIEKVITETVSDSVNKSMESVEQHLDDVKTGICHLDKHLQHAEHHIIDEIHTHANNGCCCGGIDTYDLDKVVEKVNQHIDEKFDEVDFMKQFGDLNQQVTNIYDKITE